MVVVFPGHILPTLYLMNKRKQTDLPLKIINVSLIHDAKWITFDKLLFCYNRHFQKIYLNIKMSVFKAKKENILAGFICKHDKIYVS